MKTSTQGSRPSSKSSVLHLDCCSDPSFTSCLFTQKKLFQCCSTTLTKSLPNLIFTSTEIPSPKSQAPWSYSNIFILLDRPHQCYCEKALRMVAILCHLRSAHRLRIYRVYIHPLLEYSSTTWSALPASSAHRLQSVQNKALTIANIDLNTLASLQERRAAALSSLFDRILSDSVPSHLLNFCYWPSVSALSNRNLRNSAAVRLPRPKSSLLLSSPLFLAGSAFNHSCTYYFLRFTLLISLIAFVCLFIYLFIYLVFPSYRFFSFPILYISILLTIAME